MGRPCITNGENWNAYRILVGKPEGKRPLGRPGCRWVDSGIGMESTCDHVTRMVASNSILM
jgi:hypothetical protein